MSQPTFILTNLYTTTLTYQGQAITSGSTYTPSGIASQVAFASDASLINDVGIGYIGVNFSTGSGITTGQPAVQGLQNFLNLIQSNNLVYSAPTTASVNTTSTLILAANTSRTGLYLSNTSTQQISLGFNGNAAAYQNGITLFPGEKFWMDASSFSTGAIYAITSGSTTYIGIQEMQ